MKRFSFEICKKCKISLNAQNKSLKTVKITRHEKACSFTKNSVMIMAQMKNSARH